MLADLRAGRSAAWTGLTFGYPAPPTPGEPEGLRVTGVQPGAPAAEGVEPGALLAGVDGTETGATLCGYCAAVGAGVSGDEVVLNLDKPGTDSTRVARTRLA